MPRFPRLSFVAVAFAAAASLALAACGGSSPSPSASASAQDNALKFAQCMRQHGIAFPDPNASGQQQIRITDPQAFRAADAACARYRALGPKSNLTPAQKAAFQDKALQFARCMRAHGVNIPDPQTTAGGGAIEVHRIAGGPGPDPQSPIFQRAQQACQSLLPKGPNTSFHSSGGPGPNSGAGLDVSGGKAG